MFRKQKKTVNIIIEDYIIRLLENAGQNISSVKRMAEKPLPLGLIENGKIIDEIVFFEFMKDVVKEFNIKNRQARFYVPNSLVIMRQVEIPAKLNDKDIRDYIYDEVGKSIHLPFKEPVFDIHYLPNGNNDSGDSQQEIRQGTLFAASEAEVRKYTDIFVDASLKPIAADVEALGVYRYFHHVNEISDEQVYLFIKFNVNSMDLSIFHQHQLEFLRYEILDLQLKGSSLDEETQEIRWEYEETETQIHGIIEDMMLELERVMNFYQFSIQKGEKKITKMVVLGDHPLLEDFYQTVQQRFEIPVQLLKGYLSNVKDKEIPKQYIPALGLALKGGAANAS